MFVSPLIFLTTLVLAPAPTRADDLALIYNSYKSMVHILAEAGEVFNAGQQTVQDPQTGKVYILTDLVTAKQEKRGIGIVVSPAGLIVTNLHIINEASRITVTIHDGKQYDAVVVYKNSMKDLAILYIKPEEKLTMIQLANSNMVKAGNKVFTLGSAARTDNSLSTGTIDHVELKEDASDGKVNSIQVLFDFEMTEGDSGRPIFDEFGNCIGIIAAGAEITKNFIYAIPSNMIRDEFWKFLNNTKDQD